MENALATEFTPEDKHRHHTPHFAVYISLTYNILLHILAR